MKKVAIVLVLLCFMGCRETKHHCPLVGQGRITDIRIVPTALACLGAQIMFEDGSWTMLDWKPKLQEELKIGKDVYIWNCGIHGCIVRERIRL